MNQRGSVNYWGPVLFILFGLIELGSAWSGGAIDRRYGIMTSGQLFVAGSISIILGIAFLIWAEKK